MMLIFSCDVCKGSNWIVKFNTEKRYHTLVCVGCKKEQILETVTGNKKLADDIKKTTGTMPTLVVSKDGVNNDS